MLSFSILFRLCCLFQHFYDVVFFLKKLFIMQSMEAFKTPLYYPMLFVPKMRFDLME